VTYAHHLTTYLNGLQKLPAGPQVPPPPPIPVSTTSPLPSPPTAWC